jgi:putative membrane protein
VSDPRSITRPDESLLRYYFLVAALANVAFPFVMLPLWFRYHTLKYRFDDEGVSMSWGILWRREIHLTYRRIQDIHVTQNVVERWMGLSKVHVQTASGTAGATMTVEGLKDAGPLRDFLYERMRGARGEREAIAAIGTGAVHALEVTARSAGVDPAEEALVLLREIRDTLRARRERGEAAP